VAPLGDGVVEGPAPRHDSELEVRQHPQLLRLVELMPVTGYESIEAVLNRTQVDLPVRSACLGEGGIMIEDVYGLDRGIY
jgi:hypothetical protein